MVAGSGKWVEFGALLARCAGPNLEKIQAGIKAENARSEAEQPTLAKRKPGRKKQSAVAAAT